MAITGLLLDIILDSTRTIINQHVVDRIQVSEAKMCFTNMVIN